MKRMLPAYFMVTLLFVAGCASGSDHSDDQQCEPLTCEGLDWQCGTGSDGCGRILDCGECQDGYGCSDHVCVQTCEPFTCEEKGWECGAGPDGCGGTLDCGECQDGYGCSDHVCVQGCDPVTCEGEGWECGTGPDGCGGTVDCGTCGEMPDECLDDHVLRHYLPPVCSEHTCVYDHEDEYCDLGCAAGACVSCTPRCSGRTCGDDGCGGLCSGRQCQHTSPGLMPLTILTEWYDGSSTDSVTCTGDDGVTTSGLTFRERLGYAVTYSAGRCVTDGAPAGFASTTPIHRLYTPNWPDYMDSGNPSEGSSSGFSLDRTLGCLLVGGYTDLDVQLARYYVGASKDHITQPASDPSPDGGNRDFDWHYVMYGGHDSWEDVVYMSGSQVRVGMNRAAGGALWSLEWNGKDFINCYDLGRQVQMVLRRSTDGQDLLKEAGDRYSHPVYHSAQGSFYPYWHPSVLRQYVMDRTNRMVYTETHPLEWNPGNFLSSVLPSGSQSLNPAYHPVMWAGTFSKTMTLDFGGNPHVMKWAADIELPQENNYISLDIASAFLTADFTQFYAYMPSTSTLVDKTASVPSDSCLDPRTSGDTDLMRDGAVAVIAATSDGAYALGLYRRAERNVMMPCRFVNTTGTAGKYDYSTSVVKAVRQYVNGLDAGTYEWTVYVVVGCLQDVTASIDSLYVQGY